MSTTHVVTGAIGGAAPADFRRLNRTILADFVLSWTAIPVVAAAISALAFTMLQDVT